MKDMLRANCLIHVTYPIYQRDRDRKSGMQRMSTNCKGVVYNLYLRQKQICKHSPNCAHCCMLLLLNFMNRDELFCNVFKINNHTFTDHLE